MQHGTANLLACLVCALQMALGQPCGWMAGAMQYVVSTSFVATSPSSIVHAHKEQHINLSHLRMPLWLPLQMMVPWILGHW